MNIWKRYSMRVSKNWVKFNKMFTLSPCAMGGRSVEAFFISCDDHYLAKNLSSIRDEVMAEGEALTNYGDMPTRSLAGG